MNGSGPVRFRSPGEACRELAALASRARPLVSAYRGGIDPDMRERVMVAVSHANECEGCTRVHNRWALRSGVSESDLESIGLGDLAGLDGRNRAAVIFAVDRSENRFPRAIDRDLALLVAEHLSNRELNEIDAVARLITFANLSVGALKRMSPTRKV